MCREKRFILTLIILCHAGLMAAQTQTAKKTSHGRGYLEFLPAGYSSSSNLYPCIIFLHGSGERGDGSPAALEKVKAQGIPKFIKNGANMCFTVNGKTECFIVLSPQQTTNRWGWQGDVIPFVKDVMQLYRIDPDRLYITGLSMGGDGSWDTSYASENEPNYFAAMAPVSCKGDYNGAKKTAARKIAVWAFHGSADTAVPVSDGQRPINGMLSANPNPAPIFTIYSGTGHSGSTWDRVYATDHTYHNPNMYEWFLTKKRNGGNGSNVNVAPVANAGADKTITLPTNSVSLTGSGTDADGQIVSYSWTQKSGPNQATLSGSSTTSLSVSNCIQGQYVFTLTVTDNGNKTATDDVTVTVVSNVNMPPVVNAGNDVTLTMPTLQTKLTAIASDPDGSIASYNWVKTWGPTVTISNPTSPTPTITGTGTGSYTFRVTVTDNKGLQAFDDIKVNIVKAQPVSDAGPDKQIYMPTSIVTLDGSGTDADGTIISYSWVQISGPTTGLIANTGVPITNVSQLTKPGEYVFMLAVTDNDNQKATDYVRVRVWQQAAGQQSAMRMAEQTMTVASELEQEISTADAEDSFTTALNQNYPNPFVGSTTIPFSVSRDQHVVLKVYDYYGIEVATLIDADLPAGEHSVPFTVTGNQAQSKFFIFKLFTQEGVFVQKSMVLQ